MASEFMQAARLHGNHDIRIDEVPIPIPKADEVLIEIEWCGICGSDLHEYTDGPTAASSMPHPLTNEAMPAIMGHEFCGTIHSAPENSSFKPGQAVMVDPRLHCRTCSRCTQGATHACTSWGFRGYHGKGGGLSEFIAVEERLVHLLPGVESLAVAALIEPLAVAVHAVKMSGISDFAGKAVLILGGGPIGIVTLTVLRMKGAAKIFLSEPTAKRRLQCEALADRVFDPFGEEIGDGCRSLTGGEGVDFVFDCAGSPPGMLDGMDALTWAGSYINVAGWVKPFVIPMQYAFLKEITIKYTFCYDDDDFRETVEAFRAGAFQSIEQLVTSRILLKDVVEKGFEQLLSNTDDHIKILVSPKRQHSSSN
ncbi:threonine dehydrogenase [Coleophoma cylindrospora]|uniref:Threonine dehydrogenase n=1 Tax=Coleophoma cylindrospora TaxID=1849047 RepID=A0A3D8S0Y4_9HELO|nr:threonine dehydrogenase [Coleophoma cylindrospora]